jgi:hypothetical protein
MALPMTASSRVDLWVPFSEKAQAKAQGALFDQDREVWYAPPASTWTDLHAGSRPMTPRRNAASRCSNSLAG